MNINAINFTGKGEINALAKKYGKLTPQEEDLKQKAIAFHEAEVITSSDGDYCFPEDQKKINEYLLALNTFRFGEGSKFAYKVALDTVTAEAANVGNSRFEIKQAARDIAANTPEVTKANIFRDWKKLT